MKRKKNNTVNYKKFKMADCKISSILNTIGSQNSSDLNPWCDGKYKNDNNFSLSNNQTCTVSSTAFPNYPKGSSFTCQNGSLTSVIKQSDGTITDSTGKIYKDVGGGNIVAVNPPVQDSAKSPVQDSAPPPAQDSAPSPVQDSAPPAAESNSMTIIIVIVLLLAVGGGAFMFMRKSKVSSMTAFGRKLSKMTRMRR